MDLRTCLGACLESLSLSKPPPLYENVVGFFRFFPSISFIISAGGILFIGNQPERLICLPNTTSAGLKPVVFCTVAFKLNSISGSNVAQFVLSLSFNEAFIYSRIVLNCLSMIPLVLWWYGLENIKVVPTSAARSAIFLDMKLFPQSTCISLGEPNFIIQFLLMMFTIVFSSCVAHAVRTMYLLK